MSRPVDLSIIILNYKMEGLLHHCLKSIYAHPHRLNFEVIVVDNASQDDSEQLVRERYPQAQFIQTGANLGHAKGNNAGIRISQGRYIMILNPDTVFLEPMLDDLISLLDARSEVGMATVQLRNPDGSIQSGAWRFHRLLTPLYTRIHFLRKTAAGQAIAQEFAMQDWDRRSSRDVDWVQGSCLTVRRDTMEEIGLLDERFFLYFTDVDWCRRAWAAGWKVHYFHAPSLVHYFHRESADASGWRILFNKASRLHIRDWILYLHKYQGQPLPR